MKNLIALLTIAALLIIPSCGDDDSGGGDDEMSCIEQYYYAAFENDCRRDPNQYMCFSDANMAERVQIYVDGALEDDPGYCESDYCDSYDDCFCKGIITLSASPESCVRTCTGQ